MKNKHILNIGLPRCATTWLWHNTVSRLDKDIINIDKENALMFNGEYGSYKNFYKDFNVSANFNPNLWSLDTDLIRYVGQYATHISIIFRNPYDFIERVYDFFPTDATSTDQFINFVVESRAIDYYEICNRWTTNTGAKFKIFYFEDVLNDPKLFLSKYFTFCELDATIVTEDYTKVINQNSKSSKIKLEFSNKQTKIINQYIDNFSKISNRDLSHWIR